MTSPKPRPALITMTEADYVIYAKTELETAYWDRERLTAENTQLRARVAELEKHFERTIDMLLGYADAAGLNFGTPVP